MTEQVMGKSEWVEENVEVKEWLTDIAKRSEATAYNREFHIYHYLLWLKEEKGIQSPKQLLEHFEGLKGKEKYLHNTWLKEYSLNEENKEKSLSWRTGGLSSVRGFYEFHHCPLPDEKIDLRVREVDAQKLREKAMKKPMTLDDFRRLIAPAKIRDKSSLLTMLQSGMGVGEIVKQFNVCTCDPEYVKKKGHICACVNVLKQLRAGKKRIKIYPLIAFKRHGSDTRRDYFTYIEKDAVEALKQYLVYRKKLVIECMKQLESFEEKQKQGISLRKWEIGRMKKLKKKLQHCTPDLREGEPIYISNRLNPITVQTIQNAVRILKKQTGLTDRDFTSHTCRDLFKTECDHAGIPDHISEFWIRHSLDKYGYNQLDKLHPEDFDEEYDKVAPALNIISSVERASLKVERIKKLETEVREKSVIVKTLAKNGAELKDERQAMMDQIGLLQLQLDTTRNTLKWFLEQYKKDHPEYEEEMKKQVEVLLASRKDAD